jgi:predicted DNA-binding transcriptional regulator AlpA
MVTPDTNIVVTEGEAARMLGISMRTLQRLRVDGGGPTFVKLTERRLGYAVEDLQKWVRGRARASTSAAAPARDHAA